MLPRRLGVKAEKIMKLSRDNPWHVGFDFVLLGAVCVATFWVALHVDRWVSAEKVGLAAFGVILLFWAAKGRVDRWLFPHPTRPPTSLR